MAKTRNNKRHNNKRQKTNKRDKILNNKRLKTKNYAGLLKTSLTIQAQHEENGDIASRHIRKILHGLPQNRNNKPPEEGALKRQLWLEKQDFKAFKQAVKKNKSLKSIPLPRHALTTKQKTEIIHVLRPNISKRNSTKYKEDIKKIYTSLTIQKN